MEFGKVKAKAWELHQSFCEFVRNLLVFLMYLCSLLLKNRILLDFFGFCTRTFPVLQTLLLKVFDAVPFCVCE